MPGGGRRQPHRCPERRNVRQPTQSSWSVSGHWSVAAAAAVEQQGFTQPEGYPSGESCDLRGFDSRRKAANESYRHYFRAVLRLEKALNSAAHSMLVCTSLKFHGCLSPSIKVLKNEYLVHRLQGAACTHEDGGQQLLSTCRNCVKQTATAMVEF